MKDSPETVAPVARLSASGPVISLTEDITLETEKSVTTVRGQSRTFFTQNGKKLGSMILPKSLREGAFSSRTNVAGEGF